MGMTENFLEIGEDLEVGQKMYTFSEGCDRKLHCNLICALTCIGTIVSINSRVTLIISPTVNAAVDMNHIVTIYS